ncbi:hypothetical protein [Sphingorhabdus pulchriflava]|nr:hypothetical protein [Sphingorhabdus pulchriflava]
MKEIRLPSYEESIDILLDEEGRLPIHELAEIAYFDRRSSSGCELAKQEAISEMLAERGVMPRFPNTHFDEAISQYQSFDPKDAAESILVIQMMTVHKHAMDLFRAAANSSICADESIKLYNQGNRLMKTYSQQMAALGKHRVFRMKKMLLQEHLAALENEKSKSIKVSSGAIDEFVSPASDQLKQITKS